MPATELANLLLIVYAVCELVAGRRRDPAQRRADKVEQTTTMLLMVAYVVGVLAINGDYPARAPLPAAVIWAGLGVGAAGCLLRLWAMQALGRAYTRALMPAPGLGLCTHGPYRLIRHPGYLGDMMIWAGATLTARNPVALAAVAALVAGACAMRMQVEENLLLLHLNDAYRRYRARSWRLLPKVY